MIVALTSVIIMGLLVYYCFKINDQDLYGWGDIEEYNDFDTFVCSNKVYPDLENNFTANCKKI